MKAKFTLTSKKSDIPLTQHCLHKEMRTESKKADIYLSMLFCFIFYGWRKISAAGKIKWNMTFKHQFEHSFQSLTGVLDMN